MSTTSKGRRASDVKCTAHYPPEGSTTHSLPQALLNVLWLNSQDAHGRPFYNNIRCMLSTMTGSDEPVAMPAEEQRPRKRVRMACNRCRRQKLKVN